ncbi:inactive serine protease 45 [Drosophila teissieri]|uniref:inactive serine protease 45 n=1 Tax=Drosophila teissieri TaxID=7243 RepID=UPI001CBA3269|nr:inactive serine protease 45 [Drosophila teissieri]
MNAARWIVLCTILMFDLGSPQTLEDDCVAIDQNDGSRRSRDAPWLAEILSNSTVICAGTLINNRYVLTAASCFQRQQELTVRLGSGYSNNSFENFRVSKAILQHPDYYGNHTVCLLRLQTEVKFKTHIRPMCITKSFDFQTQGGTFEIFSAKLLVGCQFSQFYGRSCDENKRKKYLQSKLVGSPWTDVIANGPLKGMVRYGILMYRNTATFYDVYISVMAHINWIAKVALDIHISTPNTTEIVN